MKILERQNKLLSQKKRKKRVLGVDNGFYICYPKVDKEELRYNKYV